MLICFGFNGRIGFIKVQHVEQAENDAVDLIGLGPLAMAQDIFNDQRVDTKMVADLFHVPFPDTVHIDPCNTIGIEVWITPSGWPTARKVLLVRS